MTGRVTYAAYRAAQAVKRLDGTESEVDIAAMIEVEVQATLSDASAFVFRELGDDAKETADDLKDLSPDWIDREN